ncbi:MAG: hypothetical protein R3Y11_07055 [Pseudomonadota bacterium]
MSEYFEHVGQLEGLKKQVSICESAIQSHKESIRNHLPLLCEAQDIDGDLIVSMAIALNEKCMELRGLRKKMDILERAMGQ